MWGRWAEKWGTGLSCVVVSIAKVPLAKRERGLKSSLHLLAKGLAWILYIGCPKHVYTHFESL